MANPEIVQILQKAKNLIETPNTWIQGAWSKGSGRDECFCLAGAIGRSCRTSGIYKGFRMFEGILHGICVAAKIPNVARWNDVLGRKHSEVIEVLDKAIEYYGG